MQVQTLLCKENLGELKKQLLIKFNKIQVYLNQKLHHQNKSRQKFRRIIIILLHPTLIKQIHQIKT